MPALSSRKNRTRRSKRPTCTLCQTRLVRLAPQQGMLEKLLGFFTIYPLRCQICANRFMTFYGKIRSLPKRDFHRVSVHFPVWFRPAKTKSDPLGLEGTLENLTVAGCLIASKVKPPKGSRLGLEFEISEEEAPIAIKEAVVRTHLRQGIGVRFVKVRNQEKKRIGKIVHGHLSQFRNHGVFETPTGPFGRFR